MSEQWLRMSAGDLGRAIATGEIDPVALTHAYLGATAAHEQAPRIYARMTRERALAEAEAAAGRARSDTRLGPLDGVPVSWKDLFDTAGTVTEAGSHLILGRLPERDAQVLRTATRAGLICLGKTHMSELAFSGIGLNPVTETPPNVFDPAWVPGGSSSGAAASVAFGLAPAAIGSDTGGSVRIPAAWNGLVGLKTTSGRLSLDGVVPLCPRFDTVGPLARNVEDCALLLAALEGSIPAKLDGASLKGVRLAVLDTIAMEGLRDAPSSAFWNAVEKLRDAGAVIEHIDAPEVAQAMDLTVVLYTVEAYATWCEQIEAAPDLMFSEILARFRAGAGFTGVEYVQAWQRLDQLRAAYLDRTERYDAVILPTSPILPPVAARMMSDHDYYVSENLLALRNTRIGNLLGLCALTLPAGIQATGISFQAAPGREEALLRLGAAAETALA